MQKFVFMLLMCSVTVSAIAICYMAMTPILRKRYSEKWCYYAWLVLVIGLIIPFRPQFNNAPIKVDIPGEMAATTIHVADGTPLIIPAPMENTVLSLVTPSISVWQITTLIWLAGALVYLAYHLMKYYRFEKMAGRWSERITDEMSIGLLQKLKTEIGISKQIRLYKCLSVGSPMLIGMIRPRILLPNATLAQDELRFILKHELIHFKRKDLYYKTLVMIATAIHWFNPVVHLMGKAIDEQCELSCDAETVSSSDADTRQLYSEAIIGVVKYQSKLKTAFSTNFYGGKKGMKNRITSIFNTKKKRTGIILVCAILVLTLGTGAAFASRTISREDSESILVAYISENYSENDARALQNQIRAIPNVDSVTFVSRQQAMDEFMINIEADSEYTDISSFRDRYIVYITNTALIEQTINNLLVIQGIHKVSAKSEIDADTVFSFNENKDANDGTQSPNANDGVEMIVNSIMPNNGIYITLENKTDYEYTSDSDFVLYEYENNSWETQYSQL